MARTFHKVFLILNLLLVITAIPYSQAQLSQSDQSIKLHAELVVLDAQVLSKKTGRAVGGLSKEHFTIYEDDAKQHITHFSQDKLPLSIVLLLDLSGSVWPVIDQIQDGGLRALRRLKPEDEVALMTFDTEATVIRDFTQDRHLIANKIAAADEMLSILHKARQKPGDGTHIADSIYQAASHLLKAANPIGSRIILVVTDNQPHENWIAHSKIEVINRLFESGVAVYGLITEPGYKPSRLVKATDYYPPLWLARKFELLKNYEKGGKVDIYADHTGGIVVDGRKKKAEEKLVELIELIRSRYSFGYVSSNQKQDGKFRKIKLKLSPGAESLEGKLVTITRRGYQSQKRNSPSNTP